MRLRSREGNRINKKSVQGYVVPAQYFQGIQVINDGQSVQLVQAGYHSSVLDIGQAADVYGELRASVYLGEREAGPLDVPVCQSETFADLAETKPRIHQLGN